VKTQIRKALSLVVIVATALSLTACHTIHGVGEDTEKVGKKIQKEADRNTPNNEKGSHD